MANNVINNFREIQLETPVDMIIRQIRELISSRQLNPGDKLPSERQLSEKLKVGRTYVRDAIKKLEFYGILKTLPQSGTIVAGLGIAALEGLISGILQLEKNDFFSLVETRVLLEVEATRLACIRRTSNDVENIEEALSVYYEKALTGSSAVEEDFLFHLKIAEASKNSVTKSLLLIVTPEIIHLYKEMKVCSDGISLKSYNEHKQILEFIKEKDEKSAMAIMRKHLSGVLEFSHSKIVNFKTN